MLRGKYMGREMQTTGPAHTHTHARKCKRSQQNIDLFLNRHESDTQRTIALPQTAQMNPLYKL